MFHLSSSGLSVCQKFSPMEPESIFVMVGLGDPQKNTFAYYSEGLKPSFLIRKAAGKDLPPEMLRGALTWSQHRPPSSRPVSLYKSMPRSCSLATKGLRGTRRGSTLSRSHDGSDLLGACYMHGLRAKCFLNMNSFNVHRKSSHLQATRLRNGEVQ